MLRWSTIAGNNMIDKYLFKEILILNYRAD